jgi:hypothetical protein
LKGGEVKVLDVVPSSRKGDVELLPLQDDLPPAPAPPPPPPKPCYAPATGPKYVEHTGMIGSGLMHNGYFNCSGGSAACPTAAEAFCNTSPSCRSFAIDPAFPGGGVVEAELYTKGVEGATVNPAWNLWVRQCVNGIMVSLPSKH